MGPASLQVVGNRRNGGPAVANDGPVEVLIEGLVDDTGGAALPDLEQRLLLGSKRPEPPLVATELEAGFVDEDHLGRPDMLADSQVFIPAGVGHLFGDLPRRCGREVEVEQLVEPVGDLGEGQPILVSREGGFGEHPEAAFCRTVRVGRLDVGPTDIAWVEMQVIASGLDRFRIRNLPAEPRRDVYGLTGTRTTVRAAVSSNLYFFIGIGKAPPGGIVTGVSADRPAVGSRIVIVCGGC